MYIKELEKNWDEFARTDPLWSILTYPGKKGNKWNLNEFFKTGEDEIKAAMEYIKLLVGRVPKKRALDFGCGVGRLTQALCDYFEEVYGVDIAESMIGLANKYNRHITKCKYFLNITDNLNLFPDKSFDFIYTSLVLQHMSPEYSKKYVKEFLRILEKNGILIFQLPSERIKVNGKGRELVRLFVPSGLLEKMFYFRIGLVSILSREPTMEMHSIKKEEIIQFVKQNGGKIVDIRKDQMNHGMWNSYIYCVTKE